MSLQPCWGTVDHMLTLMTAKVTIIIIKKAYHLTLVKYSDRLYTKKEEFPIN